MLMRLDRRYQLKLLFLGLTASMVAGGLLAAGCGGGDTAPRAPREEVSVRCSDEQPGDAAAYANDDVAIGRDSRRPLGAAVESHRWGGRFPWFAKTGLFVRGDRPVAVRVPSALADSVAILGWTQPPSSRTSQVVRVDPGPDCPGSWTGYPGGLVFRGRHCVRLTVEGPGSARGSLLVGLRTDCPRAKR
jgi:hypothetical protein